VKLSGLVDTLITDPVVSEAVRDARNDGVTTLDLSAPTPVRPVLLAAIAAAQNGAGRPVLAVTATFREAEELTEALQCLVEEPGTVAYYPAWETLPHERLSPRSDTVGRRLAVLRRLVHPDPSDETTGPIKILVAPVRSVLQPQVAGLADLKPVQLHVGDTVELEDVVERLAGAAYHRVDLVERRGEFAVRGGIIDVFPPTEEHPLRVDFFGDDVEEIRYFAVADQRSLEIAEHGLWAPPCRELLLTDEVRARAAVLAKEHPENNGWEIALVALKDQVVAKYRLALVVLIAYGWVSREDGRVRAFESEQENKRNQEAILRLLNEMGNLADGDLTVQASVTEDVTGAIADSINFTIEELRTLVRGINSATDQVAKATTDAQAISNRLYEASQRQNKEIQQASASVLQMAQSINEVSQTAAQSARVAQQSLAAAEKGGEAVHNQISGMNEIRTQIQDTAKRIKRLGESSLEIGEIVELISDITEQTNVLALNAAIQAASAGEAGRGFTVVAEEVQRLAERSGEATKQIEAIVKTIQADTQDAVAAMEKSTVGVVEGTKLSDAAGQALDEIRRVSRELAELIGGISAQTQKQSASVSDVTRGMQGILKITEETTEGTKQTNVSIGQLTKLAAELRSSVAGFKV